MRSSALAHMYLILLPHKRSQKLQCYLCACIVLKLIFMVLPINNYNICANACLKHSELLISAQQPFVVRFSYSESWCVQMLLFLIKTRVWIVTENPVRCKYACTRSLPHMPMSNRSHISHEIQKIHSSRRIALCKEKGIMLICAMQRINPSLFCIDR